MQNLTELQRKLRPLMSNEKFLESWLALVSQQEAGNISAAEVHPDL